MVAVYRGNRYEQ